MIKHLMEKFASFSLTYLFLDMLLFCLHMCICTYHECVEVRSWQQVHWRSFTRTIRILFCFYITIHFSASLPPSLLLFYLSHDCYAPNVLRSSFSHSCVDPCISLLSRFSEAVDCSLVFLWLCLKITYE